MFSHDVTTAMLVCQTLSVGVELFSYVKTLFFPICIAAGHVGKTLYTKTLRTVKTSPLVLFFCQAQFKRRTFHYQTPSIKYKKRLTFESIKSDISNLARPMRTWEFRLRSDVD